MRKRVTQIVLFAALAVGALRGVAAGEQDNAVIPDPGSAVVSRHEHDSITAPAPFKKPPLEAAQSLLAELEGKTGDALSQYVDENRLKIVFVVRRVRSAIKDGELDPQDPVIVRLSGIGVGPFTGELSFRLYDLTGRTGPGGGPRGGHPEGVLDNKSDPGGPGAPGGSGTARTGPGGQRHDPLIEALVMVGEEVESGNTKQAEENISTLQSVFPRDPDVHTAAAEYFNEMENFARAADSATTAITLAPDSPDAYKARALARSSMEDRKGAIEDIRKAMAADPQDESARILSALIESRRETSSLRSLASLQDIKRSFEGGAPSATGGTAAAGVAGLEFKSAAAAQVPPQESARAAAYLKTAASKTRLGDYEAAARYATMALDRNPASDEAHLERANAYNFLGRYEDAVRDTTRVLDHDPGNVQALNMRAWALNRKGMFREAEGDAGKAIKLNPGYADSWFNRALAYEKMGDYKRMLEDFRQAASLNTAYASRFRDAVAQYSGRVQDFDSAGDTMQHGVPVQSVPVRNKTGRFAMTLGLTLSGGLLIAFGMLHIVSGRRERQDGRDTQPDILSPSIFYEGVTSGKYKIERKLGEGGMGVVYAAVDQSLERPVAIKRMNDEIKLNENEKQRFLQEARTVALLHHPNIVEIYTIFEEDDNIYLVFEFIDGPTLDKKLEKDVMLGTASVVEIFDQVCKALAYAHSKNVVHRDLKLGNIMINSEGDVKVMDFGLARSARETLARGSREVVGSPAYMAPEQACGVSGKESDIYSLGVCVYESLTGTLPFPGPDFQEQKEKMRYHPVSSVMAGIPRAFDPLLEKAMDPDPDKRFRTIEEFRAALLAVRG
ncbi:MAG: protein kinase [Elusimicrobia bacterium]|nr:MAG: protein kinase [Elusimicrobiota bacterium]KAF0156109.1 MAG: protein kinase [Elusimicrobiota bacterium]